MRRMEGVGWGYMALGGSLLKNAPTLLPRHDALAAYGGHSRKMLRRDMYQALDMRWLYIIPSLMASVVALPHSISQSV